YLCTIPATSVSSERSFSKLKLIKTRLRSTMQQNRLESLLLLSCEKDIDIDLEEAINKYALNSNVLKKLFSPRHWAYSRAAAAMLASRSLTLGNRCSGGKASAIVMDNASYYSMLMDNFPKSNSRKAVVEEWLKNKNVDFSPQERLSELDWFKYNPIELVWAQVKAEIAKNNNTIKMADVEKLGHAAIDTNEDNKKEILRDISLEPIIITLQEDHSNWDDEEIDDNIID
ncbi:DDE 3 domain-containing protein, partial [Aphis craccivora]